MIHRLRTILRGLAKRPSIFPLATVLDRRTVQSTPESGVRAGYNGYKRRNGSKIFLSVDALGNHLALKVTAADEHDRPQDNELARSMQEVICQGAQVAFVDQRSTADNAVGAATQHGIGLQMVKLPDAQWGFVLLPRRWVVE